MLYLKKIKLYKLWGKKNISIPLNKDVTILSGGNGTGKTTILDIAAQLLHQGNLGQDYVKKVHKTELHFEKNIILENINFSDGLEKLQDLSKKETLFAPVYTEVSEEIKKKELQSKDAKAIKVNASVTRIKNQKDYSEKDIFDPTENLSIISTFDSFLPDDSDIQRRGELNRKGVRTDLDLQLFYALEKYSYYVADLAHTIENRMNSNQSVENDFISKLYAGKNQFFTMVNDFFSETNKKIDTSKSELSFVLEDSEKISIYELSSGEKQLLYILISTLLQREKPTVMFMDEPEISLHIDWQRKLIRSILDLNPNCQLIIASHSPSMIVDGWMKNVVNIGDLMNKTKHGN